MPLYLDACTIVSIFTNDANTAKATKCVWPSFQVLEKSDWTVKELIVSDWAVLEVSNVVYKLVRNGDLNRQQGADMLQLFDLFCKEGAISAYVQSSDIQVANDFVRDTTLVLSSTDAVHMAITQRLGAELLTFDKGMLRAAGTLGVKLLS